jgi:hypothetical protein
MTVQQSRISQILTAQTMQAIVIIILILIFLLPLFSSNSYDGDNMEN